MSPLYSAIYAHRKQITDDALLEYAAAPLAVAKRRQVGRLERLVGLQLARTVRREAYWVG